MSRIGKQPIRIPKDVKVTVNGPSVSVEGPKGKLSMDMSPVVSAEIQGDELVCVLKDQEVFEGKALYGLTRSLLNNMVIGVSTGFKKELEIQGVGFRAFLKGTTLEINVGYSHPILFEIPAGITIHVEKNVKVSIEGVDKQLVGQTAAEIRAFRKPEPYKGKGIRYSDEIVRRKAGKTAAAAS